MVEKSVTLLDYGAGNMRSIRNAINRLGYSIIEVNSADDIKNAEKLIFPGVGAFGVAVENLKAKGFFEPLREYLKNDKPFLGICIGMQMLFEGSEENPEAEGLGVIPGKIQKFDVPPPLSVPHIGWNGVKLVDRPDRARLLSGSEVVYFVHSYCATPNNANRAYIASLTNFGNDYEFVSSIQHKNIVATQFHPEKSGETGVNILRLFLEGEEAKAADVASASEPTVLRKRVIACLDVRSNDDGDLVVTKGDQYDVWENEGGENGEKRRVRNLGKPVSLAQRYYEEGADEITFLNITSFRESPLTDLPMLEVLEQTSKNVFVPLTIGGGIRSYTDANGQKYSALDVAARYFRSGADKVSIGSDAVYAAEQLRNERNGVPQGDTAIEEIARVYGSQAVVISVDPRRVYVASPSDTSHTCVEVAENERGPNGEKYAWYQCTVRGGREGRDLDAHQLAKACETLGAGELLINCINKDGQKSGFDCEFVESMAKAVSIPVIASSGAGKPEHFSEVFERTTAEAALAAGIFHRKEVPLTEVKAYLQQQPHIKVRSAK